MSQSLVAEVKYAKDGKIYRFLIAKDVKVIDLKPNQVVLVKTRTKSPIKTKLVTKRAVLQDVKMEDIDEKNKPTAYLIGIDRNSKFKLLTKEERIKLSEKLKRNKEIKGNLRNGRKKTKEIQNKRPKKSNISKKQKNK